MKTQQVYKIGNCIELMRELPDKSIDLVLTDPPYGLNFDYGVNYIDTRDNLIKLLKDAIPEMMRIGKRIANLPGITQIYLYPEPDWLLCVSWNTTGSYGGFGYTQWMPILVYGDDIKGFGKVNGVLKSDCLHLNGGGNVGFQRDKYEGLHVCPKPYEIIVWLVKRLSEKYNTILDPFLGSGTTLLACMENERNGIGYELNPNYEQIIKERLMSDTPKLETWFSDKGDA